MTSVNNLISGVTQTVLKSWLRQRGLQHSAVNEGALVALIERLIDEGDLTVDDLRSGVREIEEHGGKRVYLKTLLDLPELTQKEKFERRLGVLGIPLSPEAIDSVRFPSTITRNYVTWNDNEIRVKYSETHIHLTRKKGSRDVLEERRTKFIVMSGELPTGVLRILMDPPGEVHLHMGEESLPTEAAYIEYYFQRAAEIFGESEDFDLVEPVTRLLAKKPRVFDVRQDKGWTPDNYKYSFTGRADVRQAKGYKAASGSNPSPGVSNEIRGWWLEARSKKRLTRNIWTTIKTEPSMIQFRADCLADEVDYAISTIRTL